MGDPAVPFFTQTAVLDRFMKSDPATLQVGVLETVIKSLKANRDLQSYFFRNQLTVAWVNVLKAHGFFDTAPEPIRTERGYLIERWDAQEFLRSVAKQVPDVVLHHVRTVKGNASYLERAISILRESQPEAAELGVQTVLEWMNDANLASQISIEGLELLRYLARHERQTAASQLLLALTRPYPSTKAKDHGEFIMFGSAIGIMPIDDYHLRPFTEALRLLSRQNPTGTVEILETQLCQALAVEGETLKNPSYKTSSFWRSAIEESDQDVVSDFKDVLLVGLRDSMEDWVTRDLEAARTVVERYLKDEHEILRRLGLHILQIFPDRFADLVAQQLLARANLDDTGIHHELFMLLRSGYRHLNANQQRQLIGWIIEGPPVETVERIIEWAEVADADRDDYVNNWREVWIRDRLSMLEGQLDTVAENTFKELMAKRGKPNHAAFLHWTSGGYFVSEVSPTTSSELNRKSPIELVAYLSDWQPNEETLMSSQRESFGALGRNAAQTIISDLPKYGSIVLDVAAIRPEYASGFLHANSEAVDREMLWDLRLSVCERLLANDTVRKDMRRSAYEGGWVGFRQSVMSLLEKAVKNSELKVPERLLPRIRDLLVILSDDPDPDLESDRPAEGWLGHHDPLTVAINHIRSEAIAALIVYASNKRERDIKEIAEEDQRPERMEAQVTSVLVNKVDRAHENSLAVHSVFGRELNRLYWLDKQWTVEQIPKIFPSDEDPQSIDFFVAAWDSYVISTSLIYEDLFTLLKPYYERAIENVSRGYVTKTHLNPIQRLADHLLVEYFHGSYDIITPEGQQSLIAKFFQKTSASARGEAAWSVGQQCGQHRDRLEQFWPRARALWSWRANEAGRSNYSLDFMEEMAAFSHLLNIAIDIETIDGLWPLLEAFLPYVGRKESWDRIWHNLQEYLEKMVDRDSKRTIQLYRLMHDQLKRPVWYYDQSAITILERGAADAQSQADTLLLIDKITRSGNYQFKYIVDKYL